MEQKHIFLLSVISYVILMMIGGALPFIGKSPVVTNNDKLLHFGEFFILGILLVKTVELYKIKNYYILAFIIAFLVVWLSEYIQLFVPSRSFSYKDMLADTLGIIASMILFSIMSNDKPH